MANRRVRKMIRDYGGEVMRFDELPKPAQLAIAHYMAIDGEAWELPERYRPFGVSVKHLKKSLPDMLPHFRDLYGHKKFGYVKIPMSELAASIMQDEDIRNEYDTFDEYHDWFISGGDIPKHTTKDPRPVILDTVNDFETLEDGWHRLHRYYELGMRTIPAVYYPF